MILTLSNENDDPVEITFDNVATKVVVDHISKELYLLLDNKHKFYFPASNNFNVEEIKGEDFYEE